MFLRATCQLVPTLARLLCTLWTTRDAARYLQLDTSIHFQEYSRRALCSPRATPNALTHPRLRSPFLSVSRSAHALPPITYPSLKIVFSLDIQLCREKSNPLSEEKRHEAAKWFPWLRFAIGGTHGIARDWLRGNGEKGWKRVMITSEQGGWNGYREITNELCVRKGGRGMRFACNDDGNDRHTWRFEPIPGSIGVYRWS